MYNIYYEIIGITITVIAIYGLRFLVESFPCWWESFKNKYYNWKG